jgi:N6-L-threonylcarbamoyladenine synthase
MTSLMMGLENARSLAYAWNLPLIPINHIEGHIAAGWLGEEQPQFPAVVMTVSGGHNMLVLVKDFLNYEILGDTRDDAAGEAFDKGAKILGLGYPGGPAISALANEAGDYSNIDLPRPMLDSGDFAFSFSGLKTALLYLTQRNPSWAERRADYAAAYQQAIIDTLVGKTLKAATKHHAKSIILSGGVAANKNLRLCLSERASTSCPQASVIIAPLAYTTDNAAMIGAAGLFRWQAGLGQINWPDLKADPNLPLS